MTGVVYGDGKSATPHFPQNLDPWGRGARASGAGGWGGASQFRRQFSTSVIASYNAFASIVLALLKFYLRASVQRVGGWTGRATKRVSLLSSR